MADLQFTPQFHNAFAALPDPAFAPQAPALRLDTAAPAEHAPKPMDGPAPAP